MFNSCSSLDFYIGYGLIVLAFVLSIFSINYHNNITDNKVKESHNFPYTVSIFVLVSTILLFMYEISGPIIDLIKKYR